jgi:GT2 family glycosyltransferase
MNYIKFIEANDADVFYAKTYLKDERGGQNKVHIRHWEQLNRDTLPHLATITRRALIDSVGGFDERYRICADRDLFIRLRERGARAIFFDEVVSVFELGGISSTRNTRLEDLEINKRHHLINPIRYFSKKAIYLAQKILR